MPVQQELQLEPVLLGSTHQQMVLQLQVLDLECILRSSRLHIHLLQHLCNLELELRLLELAVCLPLLFQELEFQEQVLGLLQVLFLPELEQWRLRQFHRWNNHRVHHRSSVCRHR